MFLGPNRPKISKETKMSKEKRPKNLMRPKISLQAQNDWEENVPGGLKCSKGTIMP